MSAATWVIAGASGVVGRHLLARLLAEGIAVRVLTRGSSGQPAGVAVHRWDPQAAARGAGPARDAVVQALDGADVLVNLAGASLAEGRLGNAHKRRVLNSRLEATGALVAAQAACQAPPPVWFSASAVGYYGDTGEDDVIEERPRGAGYLATVCERWEDTARQVQGARLIIGRIGLVLARDAPAWEKLLLPSRLGLGGPLGDGRQWWAWIDGDDLARAIQFLVHHPQAEGVFNLTTADPVRQGDLAEQMGLLLHRPAVLPAPAFALRLVLGGVADALLLPSCRAFPARLQELGFEFERPSIARALLALLGPLPAPLAS